MRAFQPTEREVPGPISRRSRSISGPVADLSQLNIKETAKTGSRLSPSAQKSLEHLRSGQSSPAPASYEKARRYPHRANSQRTGERHVNQPAGHTKTLATTLQDVADSHHCNREPLAAHKLGSSVSPRRQQQTRPASSASVHFSNANGRPSPARCHSEFSSPGNQPNTATTRSQPISSEAPPPPKTAELDELGQLSRQLAERSKSRRADYHLSEVESIIKSVPEPLPTRSKQDFQRHFLNSSAIHREHQDRSEYVTEPIRREIVEVRREQVVSKPKVTQTVQRFEENKRTEEVERR
uniref:Uncharacterized protein n=1 Tax=Ditylenchus dipsaci TaxID=166011 RepID=A0A915DVW9_9BILA